MRYTDQSLPVGVVAAPLAGIDADVLVIPVIEHEKPPTLSLADAATGGRLVTAFESREFTGKANTTFVTPVVSIDWQSARIMLVGVGSRSAFDHGAVRMAATTAALAARERRWRRLAIALPAVLPGPDEAQAVAEGLTLGAFYSGIYKSDPDARPALIEYLIALDEGLDSHVRADFDQAIGRGYILGACSNLARSLANEPANTLTPRLFADIAGQVGSASGLVVDVLDEERLAGLNMGLLLGVARGSAEPPRMVVLRYEPPRPSGPAVLGLVGKGVTFDTGGISIKPSDGMHKMKTDMSGGAAVLAAMKAIAALRPDVRVVGVVPLVENMPGGRAIRPGDVLRSADGKTVEVLDTDAEGRLILGDALWYARHLGATHLVDVATLTGAVGVALGRTTSGLFGTPAWWVDLVGRTANRAGDRVWAMPLFDDYREQLRSEIADLTNIGGRPAGSITAALFLKEFTGGLPWAHLDIAFTAWADDALPYQAKGPTGVAVRTLAELSFTSDSWPTAGS
ncbi:MAG: leucyl aminopeptidase [Acidobacteria bacterium]|nr:leucyl aminopeptidase [Acidobacteriota bacterium]